jgi:hypothetical protein
MLFEFADLHVTFDMLAKVVNDSVEPVIPW